MPALIVPPAGGVWQRGTEVCPPDQLQGLSLFTLFGALGFTTTQTSCVRRMFEPHAQDAAVEALTLSSRRRKFAPTRS